MTRLALIADARLCLCGCGKAIGRRASAWFKGHHRRKHGHDGPVVSQKRSRWLRKYGLTHTAFAAMLAGQGGCCAICRTASPGKSSRSADQKEWCVDHNHVTGDIRGLLCSSCTAGLGAFGDDALLLERALGYLELST